MATQTTTLETITNSINNAYKYNNTIHFGCVGHGTKIHIVRKSTLDTGSNQTICGAEISTTSMRRNSYSYTIKETEVPTSTLCGRCIKASKEAK